MPDTMDGFVKNTIKPDYFQIQDVENDNACFYRSLANVIAFISDQYIDLEKMINDKKFGEYRSCIDFYNHSEWNQNDDNQENFARELQEIALNWIKENQSEKIEWDQDITVRDLVYFTHNLSIDEYLEKYAFYAGDLVISDDNDEIEILENRWGGFSEQYALARVFKIPIIVLSAQRYDQKKKKCINGIIKNNKAYKGVYFKIFQIAGIDFLNRGVKPVYLLWKKINNSPHYMSLYPMNQNDCLSKIKSIMETQNSEKTSEK